MPSFPVFSAKELIAFLNFLGFEAAPYHAGADIPKGLLRKIIREDLGLSPGQFFTLYDQFRG